MAISERVKRLLWSRSGGYCQNQDCQIDFFTFFENDEISSIEELAHIIARSSDGPRGEAAIPIGQRDEYENIILLCPNCHSLIDKNPDQFSVATLLHWKATHEQKIKDVFIVPIFPNREGLAAEIHKHLRENRRVFQAYGPHSSHAKNPISDAVLDWNRYIHSTILPNNRHIAKLLIANQSLLKREENTIVDNFIIHKEAFEYNHVSGNKTAVAPLFPQEMNTLLLEGEDA
jgi:hypothetical protein